MWLGSFKLKIFKIMQNIVFYISFLLVFQAIGYSVTEHLLFVKHEFAFFADSEEISLRFKGKGAVLLTLFLKISPVWVEDKVGPQ